MSARSRFWPSFSNLLRHLAKAFSRLCHHGIIEPISEGFLPSGQGFQVMANTREPILHPIPILSLHPTQMTVGMREVKEKRKRWRFCQGHRLSAGLVRTGVRRLRMAKPAAYPPA